MYGYELAPIDGGTRVTQYYDWSKLHPDFEARAGDAFPVVPETAILATLGILARTVPTVLGRSGVSNGVVVTMHALPADRPEPVDAVSSEY